MWRAGGRGAGIGPGAVSPRKIVVKEERPRSDGGWPPHMVLMQSWWRSRSSDWNATWCVRRCMEAVVEVAYNAAVSPRARRPRRRRRCRRGAAESEYRRSSGKRSSAATKRSSPCEQRTGRPIGNPESADADGRRTHGRRCSSRSRTQSRRRTGRWCGRGRSESGPCGKRRVHSCGGGVSWRGCPGWRCAGVLCAGGGCPGCGSAGGRPGGRGGRPGGRGGRHAGPSRSRTESRRGACGDADRFERAGARRGGCARSRSRCHSPGSGGHAGRHCDPSWRSGPF
jgi:hypothetical protein